MASNINWNKKYSINNINILVCYNMNNLKPIDTIIASVKCTTAYAVKLAK